MTEEKLFAKSKFYGESHMHCCHHICDCLSGSILLHSVLIFEHIMFHYFVSGVCALKVVVYVFH